MDTPLNGKAVGERLSEWLEQTGETTVDLAKQNIVSRSTSSGLINGRNKNPHRDTVRRIARHYGVSIEEFLAGPEAEHPKKVPALLSKQGFPTGTQRQ